MLGKVLGRFILDDNCIRAITVYTGDTTPWEHQSMAMAWTLGVYEIAARVETDLYMLAGYG